VRRRCDDQGRCQGRFQPCIPSVAYGFWRHSSRGSFGAPFPDRASKLVHNRSGPWRFSRTRPFFRPTSSCPAFHCREMFPDRGAIDRQRIDCRTRDWRRDGAIGGGSLPPDRRQGRRHTPICGETPQRPLCSIKLNRRRRRTFLDGAQGRIRAVRYRPRPAAAFRSRVRVRPGRPRRG
jgi:hypothetical protein